jgi:hypothetical protein
MTPRSLGTKPEKTTNSEDLARKVPNLARQGASSNSGRNNDKGPHAEGGKIYKTREPTPGEGGHELGRNGPRLVSPSRPAQPVLRPNQPPFDLGASRAIYSPLTESHTSTNSSSTAEEQRNLRDTISEMRVVLVV